ncbi:hypothetical protein HMSSN036_03460 [Paenibacillus macerans]|nr:hypothetical protein HMSSN036_03460 [Paenibacillus macerans]
MNIINFMSSQTVELFFADFEQEQKYTDLVERLSDLMPNLVDSIDDKGNKHLKNAEAIKERVEICPNAGRQ